MWSEFPKLYLDLEFIGAKLKVTGPGDLLVDYKKYGSFITGGVSNGIPFFFFVGWDLIPR
jgi:hypothetical protein